MQSIVPDFPVTLVVPIFNEVSRLTRNHFEFSSYVARCPEGSELILVDDGSTDDTFATAQELFSHSERSRVLLRPHLGKGAAVAFGLRMGSAPVAGYTDVDLSTPLHEVTRLFDRARATDALVIGSRGQPTSRVTKHQQAWRESLGLTFNLLVRATITPRIRDTQCGAKFARRSTWDAILGRAEEPGFAWDAEAVALSMKLGLGVDEVGIEWRHDPMTRVKVMSDGLTMAARVISIKRRLAKVGPLNQVESAPSL